MIHLREALGIGASGYAGGFRDKKTASRVIRMLFKRILLLDLDASDDSLILDQGIVFAIPG